MVVWLCWEQVHQAVSSANCIRILWLEGGYTEDIISKLVLWLGMWACSSSSHPGLASPPRRTRVVAPLGPGL